VPPGRLPGIRLNSEAKLAEEMGATNVHRKLPIRFLNLFMSCFLEYRTMEKVQKNSLNSAYDFLSYAQWNITILSRNLENNIYKVRAPFGRNM
jgi:hypothetical protein